MKSFVHQVHHQIDAIANMTDDHLIDGRSTWLPRWTNAVAVWWAKEWTDALSNGILIIAQEMRRNGEMNGKCYISTYILMKYIYIYIFEYIAKCM